MANFDLYSDVRYFPYGYLVHITYYFSILFVTMLFVGKMDFKAVGLEFGFHWKRYFLVGLLFALIFHLVRVAVVNGTFSRDYYLPFELHTLVFVFLGLLIGLAEESAFRGYILRNFLNEYKPWVSILVSSLLFGIYHINFSDPDLSWWAFYVGQAFTGGLLIGLLYYKTERNLIAPLTYHSLNIIIGQVIPWMPNVTAHYLLAIQMVINLVVTTLLLFLPLGKKQKTQKPTVSE